MAELNIGCNEARAAFNKLMNAFQNYNQDTSKSVQIKSKVVSNSYNNEQYPEDYGGAYFDFSLGKLVVCLTEDNEFNYLEKLLDNDMVIYNRTKYSLNYLLNAKSKIYDVMQKFNISSSSIIQRTNKIAISFADGSKKEDFMIFCRENDISENVIDIISLKKDISLMSLIKAGTRVESLEDYGTVRFNAKKVVGSETLYGIVTAGHLYKKGASYYNDVSYIGSATENSLGVFYHENRDTIDAMFIPFSKSSQFTPTQIYTDIKTGVDMGSINLIRYIFQSMEGDLVIKYGVEKGRQSGQIVSTYCDYVTDKIQHKDFFLTDCICDHGDSGGPIGFESGSIGSKKMEIIGIMSAGVCPGEPPSEDDPRWAIGCKMTNICGPIAKLYT